MQTIGGSESGARGIPLRLPAERLLVEIDRGVVKGRDHPHTLKRRGFQRILDRPGHFISPAIAVASNDWDIVQTETFGPILYLIPYRTLDEAIGIQNGVAQGLSSAIFTDNLQNAEYFLSYGGSDCGIANINIGTSGAEIGGAFGGEKETGGGREAGSDAWKAYMRRQTNTINWGRDLPLAQGINFDL